MNNFADKLIDWHHHYGRKGLPWQSQTDPYKVWLSEIMLQQTQVATVIDRYQLFLIKFPDIKALASAPLEEVMALWAGLGYYTRARNLHACAQQIVAQYNGIFPQHPEELNALPGIGKSTARAIAAFCFNHPASILDANVQRVLARTHGIRDSLKASAQNKQLWELADQVIPTERALMPIYTQALMDFGATVCKPATARCQTDLLPECIYLKECWAYQHQQVSQIPLKVKKTPSKIVVSEMLLVMDQDELLLEKRPSSGIWGGLWTLPETPWLEVVNEEEITQQTFQADQYLPSITFKNPALYVSERPLAPYKHVFSHRTLYFVVRVLRLSKDHLVWGNRCEWVKCAELGHLGFPTPIKRLLEDFELLVRSD